MRQHLPSKVANSPSPPSLEDPMPTWPSQRAWGSHPPPVHCPLSGDLEAKRGGACLDRRWVGVSRWGTVGAGQLLWAGDSPGWAGTQRPHPPTAWTACPSSCMTPPCGAPPTWRRSSRSSPAGPPPCSTGLSCRGSTLASGS